MTLGRSPRFEARRALGVNPSHGTTQWHIVDLNVYNSMGSKSLLKLDHSELMSTPRSTGDSPSKQDFQSPQSPLHGVATHETNQNAPEKPFSIYTKREKWFMVAMVALAGLFRYVFSFNLIVTSPHGYDLALFHLLYISRLFLRWPRPLASRSN